MGFRQDAYAKVWKIEDKGNYSVGQVSVSKKNKNTGQYETDFQDGFVRFIGEAHESIKDVQLPEKGLTIQIKNCDVTNRYVKEKGKTYTNFAIFSFETPDGAPATKPKEAEKETEENNDDLPF